MHNIYCYKYLTTRQHIHNGEFLATWQNVAIMLFPTLIALVQQQPPPRVSRRRIILRRRSRRSWPPTPSGSREKFLTTKAGLDDATLSQLRTNLLGTRKI